MAAPFTSRPDDTFGVALAFAHVSPRISALQRRLGAPTGTDGPAGDFEMAAEITYQARISPHWSVQPDLQVIIHPGARIDQIGPPSNALVIGARVAARYRGGLRPFDAAITAFRLGVTYSAAISSDSPTRRATPSP